MIPDTAGPCAKQVVTATIIAADGQRFVGTNWCRTPQATCPRGGMPSGVGYNLCISTCDQSGHAEVNAIRAAGNHARGAVLYLDGHIFACTSCQMACNLAGITQIIVGAPPAEVEAA